MKKQPEVTAQTRQNLTDAFWSLYKKKRIEKITVREITQLAGYNRGTFYEYFLDVYDVLEQLEQSIMPQMPDFPPIDLSPMDMPPMGSSLTDFPLTESTSTEGAPSGMPSTDGAPCMPMPMPSMPFPVESFMKLYETYNEYYTVLLGDNGDSAFMSKIKKTMLPKQKEVLLANGASDGFELDAVLEYTNISMIGMLAYWFRLENKPPVEEFLALMYQIMQGGVQSMMTRKN